MFDVTKKEKLRSLGFVEGELTDLHIHVGASVAPALFGAIADASDLYTGFYFLAGTIILANFLAFFMPNGETRQAKPAEALVRELYQGLSDEQKRQVCLRWDERVGNWNEERRGPEPLARQRFFNAAIFPNRRIQNVYTPAQRELVERILRSIVGAVPEVRSDTVLTEAVRDATVAHWRSFLINLGQREQEFRLVPRAAEVVTTIAQRGQPLHVILGIYAAAQREVWRYIIDVTDHEQINEQRRLIV